MSEVVPAEIADMIAACALFAVSHSGGKDSQAQMILVRSIVPPDQLVVIHAPLGRVEWPGTLAHIRATIGDAPLILARAEEDLLAMVRRAVSGPRLPSETARAIRKGVRSSERSGGISRRTPGSGAA